MLELFPSWLWLLSWLRNASPSLKICTFFALWLLLWLPIAVPLARQLEWRPPQPLTPTQKIPLVLSLYALAPLLLWGAARLEQVPMTQYGLLWQASEVWALLLGLAGGAGGVLLVFGLEGVLGWVVWTAIDRNALKAAILPTLGLGLVVSAIEEPVFRGFVLTQLQAAAPGWLAAAIGSALFALLHLVWDGRPAIPQLPGLWLMGMVLVLARSVNGGNLALACGLHAGWIWALASLDTVQAVRATDRVPPWWTGIGGHPLAGVVGLLLLLLTGGVLWSVATLGLTG